MQLHPKMMLSMPLRILCLLVCMCCASATLGMADSADYGGYEGDGSAGAYGALDDTPRCPATQPAREIKVCCRACTGSDAIDMRRSVTRQTLALKIGG